VKYTVTTKLLQAREEGVSVHRTAEKTEEITTQSKQATGKMGSKMKEKMPNKRCVTKELRPRLDSIEIKIPTLLSMYYPLTCGISLN